MDLSPGSEFAGYRIERLIARGGMGVVYRAVEVNLGRQVVLKLLPAELAADPAYKMRFEQEARLAASVEHPNIVPIYGAGEHDGTLYIAMRHVRGPDLQQMIGSYGAVDVQQTRTIVEQIASALDHIHGRGMVHRDVKTANILVGVSGEDAGRAYLADFGVARAAASSDRNLTRMGAFLGTREYASPEQLHGADVDWRTDVYALGCVVYECLTGTPPYAERSSPQMAHMMDPPPIATAANPALPAEVDEVVVKAMAKSRDERYQSAGKLALALTAAVQGGVGTEPVADESAKAAAEAVATAAATPSEAPSQPSSESREAAPEPPPPAPLDPTPEAPPPPPPEEPAPERPVRGETVITPSPSPSKPAVAAAGASTPRPATVLQAGAAATPPGEEPAGKGPQPPPTLRRELRIPGIDRPIPLYLAIVAAGAFLVTIGIGIAVARGGHSTTSPPTSATTQGTSQTATTNAAQPLSPLYLSGKQTPRTATVRLTWTPPSSSSESTYVIERNGSTVGDVGATTTSFEDLQVPRLGTTYTYQVFTVDSAGRRSKPVKKTVQTRKPPLRYARLEGTFNVNAHTTASTNFTPAYHSSRYLWRFKPHCKAGACSAHWHGLDTTLSGEARLDGAVYRISLRAHFGVKCSGVEDTSTAIVRLRATGGYAHDGRWMADRIDGVLNLTDGPQHGCTTTSTAIQTIHGRLAEP